MHGLQRSHYFGSHDLLHNGKQLDFKAKGNAARTENCRLKIRKEARWKARAKRNITLLKQTGSTNTVRFPFPPPFWRQILSICCIISIWLAFGLVPRMPAFTTRLWDMLKDGCDGWNLDRPLPAVCSIFGKVRLPRTFHAVFIVPILSIFSFASLNPASFSPSPSLSAMFLWLEMRVYSDSTAGTQAQNTRGSPSYKNVKMGK